MTNEDQKFILTIVANNDKQIDNDLLKIIQNKFSIKKNFTNHLHPKRAFEFIIDEAPQITNPNYNISETINELSKIFEAIITIKPIDYAIQKLENRKKKLLVADMDSTIIEQECIDEIAAFAGFEKEVKAITERSMRGDILFTPALKERVALFKDLEVGVLKQVLQEKISLQQGAKTLINTMKENDCYCALISGGFTYFSSFISQQVGFHSHRANRLEIEDDKLTGQVLHPILGRHAKRSILIELRNQQMLQPGETLAIGDGANDLLMLGEAGLAIAYKAKPKVASDVNINIKHTDLTTALYFQGFSFDEFVD